MIMRKISCLSLLVTLQESNLVAFALQHQRSSARNVVKKWAGTAALATTLIASPFLFPQVSIAADVPAGALVLNVDVSDPQSLVKSAFQHRNGIMAAAKQFLQSVKTLGADLDGVVPPDAASASFQLPSDLKVAARDAASGQARILLNGSPIYFEVESEQELLAIRVLISSPILPKIPFLTPSQEALQIPATFRMEKPKAAVVAVSTKQVGFLDRIITVPGTSAEFTFLQAIQGVLIAIPSAYVLSYSYYIWEKQDNASQAAARKKKS